MSEKQYRAMIHAAVATIHFYRKDFVPFDKLETFGTAVDKNRKLVDRVAQEVDNLYGYQLSNIQISKALAAYNWEAQGVDDRPVATEHREELESRWFSPLTKDSEVRAR